VRKIFLISIFLWSALINNAYAVSSGLHLQLPDKMIDINKQDVEQLLLFQVDSKHSGIMIKLKERVGEKLTAQTQGLEGKPVVWIWNGRVLSMQKLTAPMDKDINVLNLTTPEAEEISKTLQ
jgi:hypothetical protein